VLLLSLWSLQFIKCVNLSNSCLKTLTIQNKSLHSWAKTFFYSLFLGEYMTQVEKRDERQTRYDIKTLSNRNFDLIFQIWNYRHPTNFNGAKPENFNLPYYLNELAL
jgi:hypothetical protein